MCMVLKNRYLVFPLKMGDVDKHIQDKHSETQPWEE